MTIVHLSELPEDVREHLAILEHQGDEFPEGCERLIPDEDSASSDEE